jgi:hypothetical protein
MKTSTLLLGLAAVALPACILDSSGLGTSASGTGGASSSSTASSSSAASSSGSGGHGGAAPAGDPTPPGVVSFFAGVACPAGWDAFAPAAGRTILPAIDPATSGTLHGMPLGDAEDRGHTHQVNLVFDVSGFSIAAAGGGNNSIAAAAMATLSTPSASASTRLPYVQLLACKKTTPAAPGALPAGMRVFVDDIACPAGFQQATDTAGRFPVGLPANAPADTPFGGAPLGSAEVRTHAHATSATLTTGQGSVEAVCGCCNDGFAHDGMFPATGTSGEADVGLPYVELLQCVKM